MGAITERDVEVANDLAALRSQLDQTVRDLQAEIARREKLEEKFAAIESFTKKYGYFAAGILFVAATGTAAMDKLISKILQMGH